MFSHTFVINLDRRPDRWEAFRRGLPEDWPFPQPERWSACDWTDYAVPRWWQQPRGSWGCLLSHVGVWRQIVEEGLDSALIFEDDAIFCHDFGERVCQFLDAVPADWLQVYLGGQHYRQSWGLPVAVNEHVLRCFDVNRLHAYAMRGCYAEEAIDYAMKRAEQTGKQVDYLMGDLCEARQAGVYSPLDHPHSWLVGQAAGPSDIAHSRRGPVEKKEQWWHQFYYLDTDGNKQWTMLTPANSHAG